MSVNYIPEGANHVTPYLTVSKPDRLLDFLIKVFAADVKDKMVNDKNVIQHAEVMIGNSIVMLGSSCKDKNETKASLYVYVPDVDKAYKKALELGAKSTYEPSDKFYGDRSAGVEDEFGNQWGIATHIEDVSPEEMERRCQEYMQGNSN